MDNKLHQYSHTYPWIRNTPRAVRNKYSSWDSLEVAFSENTSCLLQARGMLTSEGQTHNKGRSAKVGELAAIIAEFLRRRGIR